MKRLEKEIVRNQLEIKELKKLLRIDTVEKGSVAERVLTALRLNTFLTYADLERITGAPKGQVWKVVQRLDDVRSFRVEGDRRVVLSLVGTTARVPF
jgi:hypothetical protein